MCFGGGGQQQYAPPPPPPKDVPAPPGSDAFQRFQEIRQGLLTGQTQLIDNPASDKLGGPAKGSTNVAGGA
jgi:hypothetical protein